MALKCKGWGVVFCLVVVVVFVWGFLWSDQVAMKIKTISMLSSNSD